MIVRVVCATGDLSIAEEGHENTNREALYDTFVAPKEAVIVRFEGGILFDCTCSWILGMFRRSGLHQIRRGLYP